METREVKNITVYGESFTYEKMKAEPVIEVQNELIKRIKMNKDWAEVIESMFSGGGQVGVFLTIASFIQGIFSNFARGELSSFLNDVFMLARVKNKNGKIVTLNDDFSDNPNLSYFVVSKVILEHSKIRFFLKSTGMFTDDQIDQLEEMLAQAKA